MYFRANQEEGVRGDGGSAKTLKQANANYFQTVPEVCSLGDKRIREYVALSLFESEKTVSYIRLCWSIYVGTMLNKHITLTDACIRVIQFCQSYNESIIFIQSGKNYPFYESLHYPLSLNKMFVLSLSERGRES